MIDDLTRIRDLLAGIRAYRAALLLSREPVIIVRDADGTILDCSATFAGLLGYEPAWLQDRFLFDFVHPEDRAHTEETFRNLTRDRRSMPTPYVNRHIHRQGHYVTLQWGVENAYVPGYRVAFCKEAPDAQLSRL